MPVAILSRGYLVEPIVGGVSVRTAARSDRVRWIGFAVSGVVVQPQPPGPGTGLPGTGSGRRRGKGRSPRMPWTPTVIVGEDETLQVDRCEDDLPLCAAFAVAERASEIPEPDRRLVFALAWRMRKPR